MAELYTHDWVLIGARATVNLYKCLNCEKKLDSYAEDANFTLPKHGCIFPKENFWHLFTDKQKEALINDISIELTLYYKNEYKYEVLKLTRSFGTKPKIRQLTSGKWIITNTCKYWSDRLEWDVTIHWCNLQNTRNKL